MTRSDLPNVGKLPPELQRAAVDAMWRAYARAERRPVLRPREECPLTWVATMAEVLEAALAELARPSALAYARTVQPCDRPFPHPPHVVELTTGDLLGHYPCDGQEQTPAVALREGGPWTIVTDTRMPPGVALVGAPEQIERVLSDWTRGSFPDVPIEVKLDEVVALRVERPE